VRRARARERFLPAALLAAALALAAGRPALAAGAAPADPARAMAHAERVFQAGKAFSIMLGPAFIAGLALTVAGVWMGGKEYGSATTSAIGVYASGLAFIGLGGVFLVVGPAMLGAGYSMKKKLAASGCCLAPSLAVTPDGRGAILSLRLRY